MKDLHTFSAKKLRDLFLKGDLSAETITKHFLSRIQTHNKRLGAFLKVFDEKSQKQARALDKKRSAGKPLGKLAGIPIGIKDNTHIQGEITTCASKFLEHYRAPFSASVVRFMEEEDALFLGKLNLDEFSMGSSNENSAYMNAHNPWNTACTPGGSSGGSAAAVSARLVPMATGSDTGGSIRQPAAFCGIVGFKPTYGRVSRYGLVAFGSSLDQIGPLASSVEDAALMMETIGRPCSHDPTTLSLPADSYLDASITDLKGKVIGVPWSFLNNLQTTSQKNFQTSIDTLKDLGAKIEEVDLSLLRYSIAVYYILATAEASTNLSRFDGIRYGTRSASGSSFEEIYQKSRNEGFGDEVKKRILLGTFVLSAGHQDEFYRKAQKMRYLIQKSFNEAFAKCDYVVMPTSPVSAFPLNSFQDPFDMYLQDILSIPANLACLPAVSVPAGFDEKNMPLSLQILGPQCHDSLVLQAAHAFETATPYKHRIPEAFA